VKTKPVSFKGSLCYIQVEPAGRLLSTLAWLLVQIPSLWCMTNVTPWQT